MDLAVVLHAQTSDPLELLALLGPVTILFGAGLLLILRPVVNAGGRRYQYRKLDLRKELEAAEAAGVKKNGKNGNGHGPQPSKSFVKKTATPVRWEDWWN